MPVEQEQTLTIQQAIDLAVQHQNAGDLAKAEEIYQQVLQTEAEQPIALHLLGVIAHQVGKMMSPSIS
jgi:protein O-GlcNAc transferase